MPALKDLENMMHLLEFTADFGELHQAGLHGQSQLASRDHQATVFIGVVRHRDPQSPGNGMKRVCVFSLFRIQLRFWEKDGCSTD